MKARRSTVAVFIDAQRGAISPEEAAQQLASIERRYIFRSVLAEVLAYALAVFCGWLLMQLLERGP